MSERFSKLVLVDQLEPGMEVSETVFSDEGNVLVESSVILTNRLIEQLKNWNVPFVKIAVEAERGQVIPETGFVYRPVDVREGKRIAEEIHESAVTVTREILENLREKRGAKIDRNRIQEVAVKLVNESARNPEIFMALTNIRKFDNYLFTHSLNVAVLSILTGMMMNLTESELGELAEGGLLHDVGMCVIPREIWDSPRILDDNQFFHIKKHPIFGADILTASGITNPRIHHIVYQHHERLDGSGYPQGLEGDKIDLFARIVMVCDVFDAMNSDRKHRGRYLPYDIVNHLLKNAYAKMDHEVIRSFVRFSSLYPVGSFVKLNSGETAIVVGANKESPIRPVVKLILDSKGRKVEGTVSIDLMRSDSHFIVHPAKLPAGMGDEFQLY